MNNFIETTERYISLIDIMGFKDFVYRHTHEDVKERMYKLSMMLNAVLQDGKLRLNNSNNNASKNLADGIVLPVFFLTRYYLFLKLIVKLTHQK